MADKWPLANGNWSNAANWNGGTKPVAGDDVFADGKTVTVDEDVNLGSGNIYTTQRSGGTIGGTFSLTNNRTITATLISGSSSSYALTGGTGCTVNCTTLTNGWTSPVNGTVNGNVIGGTSSSRYGINSPAGTTTINGNVSGSNAGSENVGMTLNSGTVTINGNVVGGNGANTNGIYQNYGILHATNASVTLIINGNVTSNGVGGIRLAANASGITVACTVNGNVTAGSLASDNHGITVVNTQPTTNVTVTGKVTGGAGEGIQFRGLGTCIIQGNATAGTRRLS